MKTAHRAWPGAAVRALGVLIVSLGLPAGRAQADGMLLGRAPYPIWEHEQVAFVDWDAEAGTEALSVLPGFYGAAREFAWVVPVPAVPEVSPAPRALFTDLSLLTAPRYRHRDDGWECDQHDSPDYGIQPADVDVLQRDLVGYYDVMVLGADDAAALGDTLAAWGFLHAGNRERVTPLLDDYVQRGWVFVAMKIDTTAFAAAYPGSRDGGYVYGGLEPITLRFAVAAPVYPMRLSSVSAAWNSWIEVHVRAEHRMELPGATTTYANRIDAAEWAALAPLYPTAAARLQAGCFLTRLELRLDPEQMTSDLPLTRAATDTEFREISYGSFPLFSVFIGTWGAAWAVGKLRRRRCGC
jgi:hypothetical protein